MRPFRIVLFILLVASHLPTDAAAQADLDQQIIRVSLLGEIGPQQIDLSTNAALPLAVTEGGTPFVTLDPGQSIRIREREDELAVELPDDNVLYMKELFAEAREEARLTISSPNELFGDRTYGGALHIYRTSSATAPLRILNHIPLEEYVASVVSSEYSFDDEQGARAMAVLARTYALYTHNRTGDEYDHVDHVMSQEYRGADELTNAARRATEATAGEVLTYNDQPIQAAYFSSSGGHTANNEDLWQAEPMPYLRGREDAFDAESPHQEWTVRVNRPELLRRLSRHHGFQVRGFTTGDRSDDGRLKTVTLLGPSGERVEMQANAFRLFANEQLPGQGIRSTLFDARREGDIYVFDGSGFGHGVGLNQYGALEMSRQGYNYEEILSYYFADVSLATPSGTMILAETGEEQADDDRAASTVHEPEEPDRDTTSTRTRIGW